MLKKQKKRSRKIPYKHTIYLWIFGLVSILVIFFGIYSYYDYQKENEEIAGRDAAHKVSSIVNQTDERLENLRQYYVSAMEEDNMMWIMENNLQFSNYSRYSAAQEIMGSKKIFGDYINGYTFVNFRTSWVLSNKGLYKLEEAYNGEVLDELFTLQADSFEKNYWFYTNTISISDVNMVDRKYRVTVDAEGLSFIIRLPLANLNAYSMFIANIDMDTWQGWLQQWLSENEDLVVLDSQGQVIYATDKRLEAHCTALWNDEDALSKPRRMKVEGASSYMVSSKTSGMLGWNYYIYHDMENGQFSGDRFSGTMIFLLILIAIVFFIIASYAIYHPVGVLVKNVSQEEQKITGNELEFLADQFANLKHRKQALETVLNQQQDKLQELFELRLIRGEVRSVDEWEEYFRELQLEFYQYFAAAVMVLDLRGENETQSNVNEDAICLKLVESLPEELRKLTWMPPVYNACAIFGLFGADDEDELFGRIMEFYEGMQEYSGSMYDFKVLMGVSTTHTDYHHIRAAYRESINALTMQSKGKQETMGSVGAWEEGMAEMDGNCHFYLASSTVNAYSYNNSFEKDIQAAIKGIDKEQCYKVVDEFAIYLKEIHSHDEAMVYILRLANTILLTAIEAKVDLEKICPDGLRKIYRELSEVIEPTRVRRYIKSQLVDPVLRIRTELLANSTYSMMEEIERQIAETRGNITLTECADALGVHSTYIWKVLKMEKGKSFSDYLEEYKLDEAKRLLLRTNLTVAEIAAELNYTNAQNFIRFFSKGTGVTPGKFRKLY